MTVQSYSKSVTIQNLFYEKETAEWKNAGQKGETKHKT